MPSTSSVKKDLKALGEIEQEQILHYLEELFVFGSSDSEVENEVKEKRFLKGKLCPHCGHD